MGYYISATIEVVDGKPVIESVSTIDGELVAWDEDVFSSLLAVGQTGRTVFVIDEWSDLSRVSDRVPRFGKHLCVIERDFFVEHFGEECELR